MFYLWRVLFSKLIQSFLEVLWKYITNHHTQNLFLYTKESWLKRRHLDISKMILVFTLLKKNRRKNGKFKINLKIKMSLFFQLMIYVNFLNNIFYNKKKFIQKDQIHQKVQMIFWNATLLYNAFHLTLLHYP